MKYTIPSLLMMIAAFTPAETAAQHFAVERTGFSSVWYNDFAPVVYLDQIIWCSDRKTDAAVVYTTGNDKEGTSLWMVPSSDSIRRRPPRIFSRELLTPFNDGPITFHPDGRTAVFSRNLRVEPRRKNTRDPGNRLGLFSATMADGVWTDIRPLPFNSDAYSATTPCFSQDGKQLYFASDMPGGSGGADLYVCEVTGEGWGPPENLGPVVNSKGHESFPFMSESGILYFSSDGRSGPGGKDIYYTRREGGRWQTPVLMDPPINSEKDDFGIFTESGGTAGYFSSDRDRNADIYRFVTDYYTFAGCNSMKKNHYCYLFYDEGYMEIDTLPVRYEWSFSDGSKLSGIEVEHCFPGPGTYTVELNIIDNNTGNTFFTQSSYDVEIKDAVQPYITSPDSVYTDEDVTFDAHGTNLPGMEIGGFFWEFGDGSRGRGGEITHSYEAPGRYRVQLGAAGIPDSTGSVEKECVFKQVVVMEKGGKRR